MNAKKAAKVRGTLYFLSAILMVAMIAGCTPSAGVRQGTEATAPEATSDTGQLARRITGISVKDTPDAVVVSIQTNHLADYTLAEPPLEQAVVLYFPEAGLATTTADPAEPNDLVGTVTAAELIAGGPSKVVIPMQQPGLAYEAMRGQDNSLNILFNKTAVSPAPEAAWGQEEAAETVAAAETKEDASSVVEDATPAAPATLMEDITVTGDADALDITILADGAITDHKLRILKAPPRIVYDLPGIRSTHAGEQRIAVDSAIAGRVRHFAHPDYLRVVVDLKDDLYLGKARAYSLSNGLLIHVGEKETPALAAARKTGPVTTEARTSVAEAASVEPVDASPAVAPAPAEQEAEPAPAVAVKRSGKPAMVNRIDFMEEMDGRSAIEIGTTRPVDYEMLTISGNQLFLKLDNTDILSYRQRPLITTRFESAVDLILPVQTKKMKEQRFSAVNIDLREAVPYTIKQMDNTIRILFEPSSVAPNPAKEVVIPTELAIESLVTDTAGAPDIETAVTEPAPASEAPVTPPETDVPAPIGTVAAPEAAVPQTAPAFEAPTGMRTEPDAPAPSLFGKKKNFTGEPIALDFYKTDIRNVIRILKDVSGKNFAIDDDVSGSVTLSFVNPVPWDQVLDLILEMNNLGMVEADGIIRIATQATLVQQKESEKAALTAQQDMKKAEETLASLVTEYFSISYANAGEDILPHIEGLLSDRGHAKVDNRTNQVIMTDVEEKVEKAREIIAKIDKVTPQVMIKARIVETSSSFSREFGTEWGIDNRYNSPNINIGTDGAYRDEMGGTYTYDVALNSLSSPVQNLIGINFARIIGTPFSLDAKLSLMESTGDVKIISTPKVVTLDNKTATISQGIDYPYTVVEDGEADVKWKTIDLNLDVTPHVTPDDRISMKLNIQKNDVGEIINGEQSFNTKRASTELLVNDGDTVVIGGIIKEREGAGERGVPWISKIPVLGNLFKYKTRSDEKSELLIFITPNVVRLD
ncbi:type IV pilus secretin PilQ [Desulfosudis oleivorans]|nr:type IV pilus secretin PilQ [Desulfosudis oleivorans]